MLASERANDRVIGLHLWITWVTVVASNTDWVSDAVETNAAGCSLHGDVLRSLEATHRALVKATAPTGSGGFCLCCWCINQALTLVERHALSLHSCVWSATPTHLDGICKASYHLGLRTHNYHHRLALWLQNMVQPFSGSWICANIGSRWNA